MYSLHLCPKGDLRFGFMTSGLQTVAIKSLDGAFQHLRFRNSRQGELKVWGLPAYKNILKCDLAIRNNFQ